jgi:uncharacterized iron-regulated protein
MAGDRRLVGLALAVASLVSACAATVPRAWETPVVPWEARLGREHPLTGRIWDIDARGFIDRGTIAARLAPATFVLLGERHDNPDHHRLQAWVVRGLIAAGRRPAVAFEMFETTDAPAIARHLAAHPRDAAGLAAVVNWERSGWPPWSMYEPIAAAALEVGLPIVAANLPRASARALVRHGVDALAPAEAARLGLDRPLPPAVQAAMLAEMREAHCGRVPAALLDGMVLAQRARDAHMAERLAEAGRTDGAVLVAGAGHVRRDRGVPPRLAARVPGARIAAVGFVEVDDGRDEPGAYAPRFSAGELPFDYVWFTPRIESEPRC